MYGLSDVIAAISTPPGKGGVAVIRVSGEGAFSVIERVFRPVSGRKISDYRPRTAIYGNIISEGEAVDDGLVSLFPAPNSYTGEDTAEISCHGGILVTRTVLEAIFRAGARPAEAGEFTRRAALSGKITLTEAEQIATLLEARSREEIRLSSMPARERLLEKIGEIRSDAVALMSSMYARIDYPDEDLGDFDDGELLTRLYNIKDKIAKLLATYRTGRAITEGISTVICGKPNVGKSTLYNLLVGEDAAIVTDIPGTTRDLLERTTPLGRILLRLCDTAGIREGDGIDTVERLGIERSREKMEKCELLFAIFDVSEEKDEEDERLLDRISKLSAAKIAILNKCELERKFDSKLLSNRFDAVVEISAKSDEDGTVLALSKIVDSLFTDEKIKTGEDAVLSSARQHATLTKAADFISLAIESLRLGFSQDAISSDVERALGAMSELDGREVSEEVVSDIFSKFCVGK